MGRSRRQPQRHKRLCALERIRCNCKADENGLSTHPSDAIVHNPGLPGTLVLPCEPFAVLEAFNALRGASSHACLPFRLRRVLTQVCRGAHPRQGIHHQAAYRPGHIQRRSGIEHNGTFEPDIAAVTIQHRLPGQIRQGPIRQQDWSVGIG